MMKQDASNDIERRKETYGCNGYCYGCNTDLPSDDPARVPMCPRVDTCPETCVGEFWASLGAAVFLCGVALVSVAMFFTLLWSIKGKPLEPIEICEETLEWHQCELLERHVSDFDKINYIEPVNPPWLYTLQTDLREYEVMIADNGSIFLVRQGDEVIWTEDKDED